MLVGEETPSKAVNAEVNSYDAIIDSNGEPMFETGNVTPSSLMDVVNNSDKPQSTTFYDISGKATDLNLEPMEVRWI